MGDRAQVRITNSESDYFGPVYLYTHWQRKGLEETVRSALRRDERWGDPEYLARIVFDEMVGDDDSATGFGIGTSLHGDVHHIIELDVAEKEVFLMESAWGESIDDTTVVSHCTFDELVNGYDLEQTVDY